jgi:hypothetical protein
MRAARSLCMFVSGLSLLTYTGFAAAERFSVVNAIEMTVFQVQPSLDGVAMFSPDGRRFAVLTERGNLHENVVESTVWVWTVQQLGRLCVHQTVPHRRPCRW